MKTNYRRRLAKPTVSTGPKGSMDEHIGGQFKSILFPLCIENVEVFTRNPPVGLVTNVVPMVMFSLTSRNLGIVVFSKKEEGEKKDE